MTENIKIGIIGCGVIGSHVALSAADIFPGKARVTALCDIESSKAETLAKKIRPQPEISPIDQLIDKSDIIVEAATGKVAREVSRKALRAGKKILIMSVGGLIEEFEQLKKIAQDTGGTLFIPSGALSGLDAVKAACQARVESVTITTRKAPRSIEGAPYIVENQIDLDKIKEPTVIFEGTALEAVKGFPKNINVAAALSLAGVGPARTRVRIECSPDYTTNSHEIEIIGEFGRAVCRTDNLPSPQNPKTSYLAVLSAVATLKAIISPAKVGT